MNPQTWPSLPAMFFAQARRLASKPLFHARRDGGWAALSWAQAAEQVTALANGLIELGLRRGDRVVLVAENRPEWAIADLAIMSAGGLTVPAYTVSTADDYRHIIHNTGAVGIIVSTRALARKLVPATAGNDALRFLIAMEPPDIQTGIDGHLWAEILERGAALPDATAAIIEAIGTEDAACILHTSGTGGIPKGAVLSHRALLSNCEGCRQVLSGFKPGEEVFLSFLPLSHSYEHTGGLMFPMSIGAEIYFSQGPEALGAEMVDVRPTVMTAVPRIFEVLHRRIVNTVERQGGMTARLFQMAQDLGDRIEVQRVGAPWDRALNLLLDRLVRRKVRARFGGRLKALVSGGAALNADIGRFFLSLGVTVLQGYGQTEAGPVVTLNTPAWPKPHTVGPPLPDMEIRFAEDGEILVRGGGLMSGYWNDPEATARTIVDGWLHTGDVGEFDDSGHLRITDRKRDFIKNSGGEMVSPQRIEGYLTLQEGIAQAYAYGDGHTYIVAVIVPEDALLKRLNAGEAAEVRQIVGAAIEAGNRLLSPPERVKRFVLAAEPFSVANGCMTPTMKIRRAAIRAAYGAELEGLYSGG